MSDILTASEVASLLRVSKSMVYELINPRTKAGDLRTNPLPHFRLGAAVRFLRADLEKWINNAIQRP